MVEKIFMIYIFSFALSLIFCSLSENFFKKNKILFFIFASICILIPCLLAGFRDSSVGIDVSWYIVPNLEKAKNLSFNEFMGSLDTPEYLFYFIIYISSKFKNSIFVCLFIIELLIIVPIYISSFLNYKNLHPTVSLFGFYMLIYNFSFSLMRQFIAASFIVLAFSIYYYRKNRLLPTILCLLSIFFHISSIFVLIIIGSIFFLRKKQFLLIFFTLLLLLLIGNIKNVLYLLSNYVGMFERYYIAFLNREESGSLFTIEIVIFAAIIFVIYSFCKPKYLRKKEMYFFFYIFLFGFLLSLESVTSSYVIRLSYYFRFFGVLLFPIVFNNDIRISSNKMLLSRFLIVSLLLMYWLYFICYKNFYNTFPYVFGGIGI